MRLKNYITELAYLGNLGFQEMVDFYQTASKAEIEKMEIIIKRNDWAAFCKFIFSVTGKRLKEGLDFKSIANSLEKAEHDWNLHQKKRGEILDAQPDGTKVTVHKREYVKNTFVGDVFWLASKGKPPAYTSIQLAIEMGIALDKQFGGK